MNPTLPPPQHFSINIPQTRAGDDLLMFFLKLIPAVALVVVIVLVVVLATGVYRDAKDIKRRKGSLYIFDPASWCFVVLLSGIFGFAMYWFVHHSRLRSHGNRPE
jgi:hypothetical protein